MEPTVEELEDRVIVADHRELGSHLAHSSFVQTSFAGVFVFTPFLARIKFHEIVQKALYSGSDYIPAEHAILSLLLMKLLGKERQSHIVDLEDDLALALFAGLNVLPKKSFVSEYSFRTQRENQQTLLSGWIKSIGPILFPNSGDFALDFHNIPHRGNSTPLETNYLPLRGKAEASIQTFLAQEKKGRVLCYANANVIRSEQSKELMKFVDFWKDTTGQDPQWLCFDSKVTKVSELSHLNQRKIKFVTIRQRNQSELRRLQNLPAESWTKASIEKPKRTYTKISLVDEKISLKGYSGEIRQIAVSGLGRKNSTLFLTNDTQETPQQIIIRYTERNHIEGAIGSCVDFFHLDRLSSEVRLNVDLDSTLDVIASGCYRWLGSQLRGLSMATPKTLCRHIIENSGEVRLDGDYLVVRFAKRSHIPVLREARLDEGSPPIPWLGDRKIKFVFR